MRLKTFVPTVTNTQYFDLFSYATNGLPGLELVGFGTRAKTIKEKILYLTKILKIKIPLKRFVICLDQPFLKNTSEEYFELPILILYWTLAGVLPVANLKDCLCAGKISTRGRVSLPMIGGSIELYCAHEEMTLIGSMEQMQESGELRLIDVAELLPRFSYEVELDRERLNHINIAR